MGIVGRFISLFEALRYESIIVYKTIVLFKLLKLMTLLLCNFFFLVLVPSLFLKFLFNLNHFLVRLLTLEMVSLVIYLILSLNLFSLFFEGVFILYFLIMLVCEGVLGLCLLVRVNYGYGSDYLFLFNKLIC